MKIGEKLFVAGTALACSVAISVGITNAASSAQETPKPVPARQICHWKGTPKILCIGRVDPKQCAAVLGDGRDACYEYDGWNTSIMFNEKVRVVVS